MAVDNVVLDPNAYNQGKGWTSRRCFNNDLTRLRNGAVQVLQRSAIGWKEYTVPFEYMMPTQVAAWYPFLVCRGANARAFLIWDPTLGGINAYASVAQNIGTGNGSLTTFQIIWTVGPSDPNPVVETVYHPVPTGTTIPVNLLGAQGWGGGATTTNVVKVNGVVKTEGTDYTINASTGVITFTVAPPNTYSVTWEGWRYIPVRLADDHFEVDHHSVQSYATLLLVEDLYE